MTVETIIDLPLDDEHAHAMAARPTWRGRLHSYTFFVAIPAGIVLIAISDHAAARATASVYAATVLALFGTSAAYHRLARSVKARRIMRRLDHAMIYLLIAGTYTPICFLALPRSWGIPVISVVGAVALLGFVLKLAAFGRMRWLTYSLYPILGWAAVAAMPVMASHLSAVELALIIGGGVIYSAGLPVLITRRPDPWPRTFGYHEVWHACTVVAGVCHFAAIVLLVR